VVDGRITAIDHDPDEERREIVVRALGGTSAGCFAVIQTWNQGRGRLPRLLRSHRTDIFDRAFHGDTAFVVSMLDAGRLDPRTRDGMGRTLLHMLAHLAYEAVLPRLLAAGVPVDARDHEGRTPLFAAVVHHGSVELIRALRDAGADPRVTDNLGRSARDWIRITRRPHLASILE
jgi:ankyrin repeat protein